MNYTTSDVSECFLTKNLILSLDDCQNRRHEFTSFYQSQTVLRRRNDHKMGWPVFEFKGKVAIEYWNRIGVEFPKYQFLIVDDTQENILAIGQSIALYWNGNIETLCGGWDDAIELAFKQKHAGILPNTLVPLAITIKSEYQGKGYSKLLLNEMKRVAKNMSFDYMIAPVRPVLKNIYPICPIEEYVQWKNNTGEIFDPWMRIHARIGAKIIKLAHKSLTIMGTVEEWENWANMNFPYSGNYVVPEALSTVYIDKDADLGIYYQPNVWMQHSIL